MVYTLIWLIDHISQPMGMQEFCQLLLNDACISFVFVAFEDECDDDDFMLSK